LSLVDLSLADVSPLFNDSSNKIALACFRVNNLQTSLNSSNVSGFLVDDKNGSKMALMPRSTSTTICRHPSTLKTFSRITSVMKK
jgi:hypothetical protein